MMQARSVPHKYLLLLIFHIKTDRGTVSNKFHQIKVSNIKITKNGQFFLDGKVRAFKKKLLKMVKKVRFAVRST